MKVKKKKMQLAMAKKGVLYRDVAEKSGVSRATLSAVMNGKSCRVETAGKIAKALGVSVADLIDWEGK